MSFGRNVYTQNCRRKAAVLLSGSRAAVISEREALLMNRSNQSDIKNALYLAFIMAFAILVIAIVLPNLMRAHEGSPPSCINNLRLIESAKEQWALENNKTNSDIPTWTNLTIYLGRGGTAVLKCPLGGI